MSNRPMKNKKKVVVEDSDEHDVEYRPPGRTSRDLVIQVGVSFLIIAFILAPMLVFVMSPTVEPQAQEQQQQQDDTDAQIQHYSQEVAKNPGDAIALANLAFYTTQKATALPPTPESETMKMTLLKEAEGNFRKSLETDPAYGFAQAELAKNLILQQNYDEAEAFISKSMKDLEGKLTSSDTAVVAESENHKVQLLGLSAVIVAERGDLPGAIAKVNEAIEMMPGNPQLYKQRAIMHFQNNDKDATRKDLTTMVDIGQKTGDQNAAMEGQMMLQMLDQPEPTPLPATATPAAPAATATP